MRIGRIVGFLLDIKSEIIVDGQEGKMIGRNGYLVAIRYMDEAINLLITQQTEIEHLKNRIGYLEESEKDARDTLEDFFGDREPDTIVEELKVKLRAYVNKLMDGEEE